MVSIPLLRCLRAYSGSVLPSWLPKSSSATAIHSHQGPNLTVEFDVYAVLCLDCFLLLLLSCVVHHSLFSIYLFHFHLFHVWVFDDAKYLTYLSLCSSGAARNKNRSRFEKAEKGTERRGTIQRWIYTKTMKNREGRGIKYKNAKLHGKAEIATNKNSGTRKETKQESDDDDRLFLGLMMMMMMMMMMMSRRRGGIIQFDEIKCIEKRDKDRSMMTIRTQGRWDGMTTEKNSRQIVESCGIYRDRGAEAIRYSPLITEFSIWARLDR